MEIIISVALALGSLYVCLHFTKGSNGSLGPGVPINAQGGWIQLAVAAVGAFAQNRMDRRNKKDEAVQDRETIKIKGDEDRRTSAFEAALADYYGQLSNQRKRNSLANFSQWSTIEEPEGGWYAPEVPNMPNTQDYNVSGDRAIAGQRPTPAPTNPRGI